jgi:hypothetical protein
MASKSSSNPTREQGTVWFRALAATLLILTAAACDDAARPTVVPERDDPVDPGGSDPGSAPETPTEPTVLAEASGTVGAAGGTVASDDAVVTLRVPANALATDTEITIQRIDPATAGAAFDGLDLQATYELKPDGLTFAEPVTVEVRRPSGAILGADGTISLALDEVLVTEEDGAAVLLTDTGPVVTAGTSDLSVAIAGQVSHFSPLHVAKIGFLGISRLLVQGLPAGEAEILREYPVRIGLEASPETRTVIRNEAALWYYSPQAAGDAYFRPDGLAPGDGAELLEMAEPSFEPTAPDSFFFERSLLHRCIDVTDRGIWGGTYWLLDLRRLTLDDEALAVLTDADAALLGASAEKGRYLATLSKEIDCVTAVGAPPPAPAADPRIGLFTVPEMAAAVEAVQVFRRRAWASATADAFFTFLFGEGDLGAILSGEGGTVAIDATTGTVTLDAVGSTGKINYDAVPASSPSAEGAATFVQLGPTGPFGGFLINFDTEAEAFFSFGQLLSGAYTDATSSCGGAFQCDEIVTVSSRGVAAVAFDAMDPETDTFVAGALSDNTTGQSYGSASPVTATARRPGGPVLVVTNDGIWLDDRSGNPPLELTPDGFEGSGASPRRVRCPPDGPVCGLTLFGTDLILPIVWAVENGPMIAEGIPVGDGPVGLAAEYVAATDLTRFLSAGFGDGSLHLAVVDGDGRLVEQRAIDAPDGCLNPGHVAFVPGEGEAAEYFAGTCYGSNQYFFARIADFYAAE